jgi:hypothetical protein
VIEVGRLIHDPMVIAVTEPVPTSPSSSLSYWRPGASPSGLGRQARRASRAPTPNEAQASVRVVRRGRESAANRALRELDAWIYG